MGGKLRPREAKQPAQDHPALATETGVAKPLGMALGQRWPVTPQWQPPHTLKRPLEASGLPVR